MGYIYTWIPAYREIVSTLRQYRNNQAYLIQVLRDIGINVPDDEDSPGHKIPLTAIDPFSFLFYLGVPRNNWNKIKAIRAICELWNINVNVYDVSGIPTANAQRLRMFSWQYMRNNEIERLWNIFEQLLQNSLTDNDFQEVIGFAGVGKTKITEAFFIVRPDAYLCINAKVKPYLERLGLNTHFETFSAYQNLLQRIKQVTDQPFPQISFHAHLLAEYGEHKPAFFRVGTTVGENGASMLPIMIQQNIISIGWHKIGNLLEIEPCNRIHVKEALQRAGYYENDKNVASRKAGEILQFKDNIFPGDYVLAAEGRSIKAIGKVVSEHYIFDDQLEFPNLRSVEWLNSNISDLQIAEGTRTSVWKYEQPESIEIIQNYLGEMQSVTAHISEDDKQNSNNSMELNIILYGPPGTGKTFHSITHAVSIIDKLDLDELKQQSESSIGRKAIKDRFDALVQSGNIVFTTFHQSLSYEDFIEGIKPLEPTPGQSMQYDVVDGVFKKLCDEAKTCISKSVNSNLSFEDAFEQLETEWTANRTIPFELSTEGKSFTITAFKSKNIPFRKSSGGTAHSLSKKTLKDLFLNSRTTFPSGLKIYYQSVLNKLRTYQITSEYSELNQSARPSNFVLIIDEINRGNVSQIFGELITLIEPDKRIGGAEEILVTLPYSKEAFGVPSNLYIIGTMNTADRSVEALDTALRRRFSFVPMMPMPEQLSSNCENIDLKALLETINKRLTVLKDKDHTIGHAWLWNIHTLNDLRAVFKDKVMPLLQEYFYNDYEKLGLVLGSRFVEEEHTGDQNIFANFPLGNAMRNQYSHKRVLTITDPSTWDAEAFQHIYVPKSTSP